MQVELAQLQYLLPRLKRMWSHLSRTRGGIGLRGPGETQLETDRRLIGTRIAELRRKLQDVVSARETQRKSRQGKFRAALVVVDDGLAVVVGKDVDRKARHTLAGALVDQYGGVACTVAVRTGHARLEVDDALHRTPRRAIVG